MTGMKGLMTEDLISIIDGTSNSRQVFSPEGQNRSESLPHCNNYIPQLLPATSVIPSTVPPTLFELGHTSCHGNTIHLYRRLFASVLSPTSVYGLPQPSSSHNAQGKTQDDVESCKLGGLFRSICTKVEFQLYLLGIDRCTSKKLNQNMSLPY